MWESETVMNFECLDSSGSDKALSIHSVVPLLLNTQYNSYGVVTKNDYKAGIPHK